MAFLDKVIIFTGQHQLLASFFCPPQEKPFGERAASVYDPDGNIIGLVQRNQPGAIQES